MIIGIERKRLLDWICDLDSIADDLARMDGCLEKQYCCALVMALRQVIKELEDLYRKGVKNE